MGSEAGDRGGGEGTGRCRMLSVCIPNLLFQFVVLPSRLAMMLMSTYSRNESVDL